MSLGELAERVDGLLAESTQIVECCPQCLSSDLISRLRMRPRYKCRYCETEFDEAAERPPIDQNKPVDKSWHDDHVPPPAADDFFVADECGHLDAYKSNGDCLRCDLSAFADADKTVKRIGSRL